MGRGRVELKRIENKINRQVTFAKRRKGLLKKALELSVLCDAEVAVIIFSPRGRLYQFCSSTSMGKTLERYQRCSGSSTQPEISLQVDETMNSYEEYLKLKARVEDLQQTQRNLLGEELGSLDMKDLEQLEHQLENSLKYIRSTKTQSMLDQLADLQKREQLLLHSNESLVKKMEKSSEHLPFQPAWEPAGAQTSHTYGRTAIAQSGDDFFYPLLYNSTSQIGYNPMGSSDHQVSAAATSTSNHNMGGTFSPHWWTFK